MKILFTTDTIQRGGKERQLFILASALQKRGHEVFVLTLRHDPKNFLAEYDFQHEKLLTVNKANLREKYVETRNAFVSIMPDIVFAWDLQTALFALLSYKKSGFVFINGSIQHGIRLFKKAHLFRSLVSYLSPYVVANSMAGLRANNLRPGKRRFVLYNGIEDKFSNRLNEHEIRKLRMETIPLYSKKPGPVFVSVANFLPYKDYFTVLEALKELKTTIPFHYAIIGDGPMRGAIENKIAELKLNAEVTIFGRLNNVMDFLQIGDCFIHSSRGEGVSNAILEAMFAGLPVIATNVGGIPETVFPRSSLLFPYKDHEALHHCLLKLNELKASFYPEEDEYKQHLAKFSVKNMVDRFEGIISEIMANESGIC